MSSDASLPPPISPRTKSLKEIYESSEYRSYPSPPREDTAIAKNYARGSAILPQSTLIIGILLLLIVLSFMMTVIFYAEGDSLNALAFLLITSLLVFTVLYLNRRRGA